MPLKDPEKKRLYQKEYNKLWSRRNQKRLRKRIQARKYKISLEELEQFYTKAKGKCSICDKEAELRVDHNHITGKVRGLLCHKCNAGIGMLCDSITLLKRAVTYLQETDELESRDE